MDWQCRIMNLVLHALWIVSVHASNNCTLPPVPGQNPATGHTIHAYVYYEVSQAGQNSVYDTTCNNKAQPNNADPIAFGTCAIPDIISNQTLVTTPGGDLVQTGSPYVQQSVVNCTGCTYCTCIAENQRGQIYGFCCNNTDGGPGCLCARENINFCPSSASTSGGQCATTGFPLASDADSPTALAGVAVARAQSWTTIRAAQQAFVGFPASMIQMGVQIGFRKSVEGCTFTGSETVLLFSIRGQAVCFGVSILGLNPGVRYDSVRGTLVIPNPIQTLFSTFTQPFFWLVPRSVDATILLVTLGTDSSQFDNPPPHAQGWFVSAFNGDNVAFPNIFSPSSSFRIFYRPSQAAVAVVPGLVAGTSYFLVLTSNGYLQLVSFSTPLSFQMQYISQYAYAINPLFFNDTAFTFVSQLGIVRDDGACGLPPGTMALTYASSITTCASTAFTYCNCPIIFAFDPVLGTLSPDLTTNARPNTPSGTFFLSVRSGAGTTASFTAGSGENGTIPDPLATGFFFVLPNFPVGALFRYEIHVILNAQQAAVLGGAVGAEWCVSFDVVNPCNNLVFTGPVGSVQCGRFDFYPIGPPPVEIVDCQSCNNCICTTFSETGSGNLCCPAFHIGDDCSIDARSCSSSGIQKICSGNGDPSFPGNIGNTGCYLNDTTQDYTCACLPEFIPPVCAARYDEVCGFPLCNGHGTCSLVVPSSPDFGFGCVCDEGYRGVQCQFPIVECFTALDQPACSGHGQCEDPNEEGFATPVCICDKDFAGAACEQSLASSCLEDFSLRVCANRGVCVTENTCNLIYPMIRNTVSCINCTRFLESVKLYALFSGLNIQNNGPSLVIGDVGIASGPGRNITGFANIDGGPGTIRGNNNPSNTTLAIIANANTLIRSQGCDFNLSSAILSGRLFPGTYCFPNNPSIVTTDSFTDSSVILDAENTDDANFIFIIPQAFVQATQTIVTLVNGANGNNIYLSSGSYVKIQSAASFTGNIIANTFISIEDNVAVTGRLFTLTGSIQLSSAQVVIPSGETVDLPCTALPNSFDVCNQTSPEGSSGFCASRLSMSKKLTVESAEFQQQTFKLTELQCLLNSFSLKRGFTTLDWLQNFCLIDVQTTTLFYATNNQIANAISCPTTIATSRFDSYVRIYVHSTTNQYIFNERCYSTSNSDFSSDTAMKETLVTKVRVGQTESIGADPRQLLLDACQEFAQLQLAPFYGIDSAFTLCWLPSVPSILSTLDALNTFPNFVYNEDIENNNVFLFWVAATTSI